MKEDAGMESFASTSSSSSSLRPTLDQLNAELFSRGFIASPLEVEGMRAASVNQLANALHAMLSQRQQDVEFREAVSAKNRSLASNLERTQRFLVEEREKRLDAEKNLEAQKAKMGSISESLKMSQAALKQAREDLQKSRRDLLLVKTQANQQRVAGERQLERLRNRFSDESIKMLKSVVPEVYIVPQGSQNSKSSTSMKGMERMQIEELEAKRSELLETNRTLRRMATEAINAAREADNVLIHLIQSEEGYQRRFSVLLGSSSSSNSSKSAKGLGSSQSSTPGLVTPHAILFTRDIFPPLQALPYDYSASSSTDKVKHPAAVALQSTLNCIHIHQKTLREAQTERNVTLRNCKTLSLMEKGEAQASYNSPSTASTSIETDAPITATAFAAARGPPSAYEERKRLESKLAETLAKLSETQAQLQQAMKGEEVKPQMATAEREAEEREAKERLEALDQDKKELQNALQDAADRERALEHAKQELEGTLQEMQSKAQEERHRSANMLTILEEERRALAKEREALVRTREAIVGENSMALTEEGKTKHRHQYHHEEQESGMSTFTHHVGPLDSEAFSRKRKTGDQDVTEEIEEDDPVEAPTSTNNAAPKSSSPVKEEVGRHVKRSKPTIEPEITEERASSIPRSSAVRSSREPSASSIKRTVASKGTVRPTTSKAARGTTSKPSPSHATPAARPKTVASTPFPPSKAATAKTRPAGERERRVEPLGVATNHRL